MNKPEDQTLAVLVQALVTIHASRGGETLYLIDKNYDHKVYSRTEFGTKHANKVRQQMLRSGDLLAVVATGWSSDLEHHVVCECYPTPGQVQTYTLRYPQPEVTWGDPDDSDAEDAIQAFKETWSP